MLILLIINCLNLIFYVGLSGFTAETEVDDDDEEECETTCRLVSRPSYECEDESWDDEEDLVLRFSSIIYVGEPPREPTYGPEEIPITLYNPETAMEEGWDWPDPGMQIKLKSCTLCY